MLILLSKELLLLKNQIIMSMLKKLVFTKKNAPFISRIRKINNTLIDDAEDLDIVMPMYNLIEYSKNYSKT